jgi:putative ABC transport system permease protein
MNRIALRMLMDDRAKYTGLVVAIAFSAFLLAHQVSMFLGILERTTSQIRDVVDADLWVMDRNSEYVDEVTGLNTRALAAVRAVPGVDWAVPMFKGYVTAKSPDGRFRQAILMGLDDASLVGAPRKLVSGSLFALREPDAIILDEAGDRYFFPNQPRGLGKVLEINDRRAKIAAIADASPPFQTFPVIFTRYSQARAYAGNPRSPISFVMVKAARGTTLAGLSRQIESQTGLKALTSHQWARATIAYYLRHTGIPVNFGIVVLVAVLVGTVVAGQTFYLFAVENVKQFAVLKAMGVTNGTIQRMVLLQAMWVAFIGYSFGAAMTAGFFVLTQNVYDLRGFSTYWPVLAGVAVIIALIVGLASLVSIRKLSRLETAMVFRT